MFLSDILKMAHDKVEKRPSKTDSNFNYVHIEDVLDLVRLSYNEGRNSLKAVERNDSGGVNVKPDSQQTNNAIALWKEALSVKHSGGDVDGWMSMNNDPIDAVIAQQH